MPTGSRCSPKSAGSAPSSSAAPSKRRTRSIPSGRLTVDSIGIVTIHDGPSLEPGEIIAPPVGNEAADANYHNNFQDPEAFLRSGGRRGTAVPDPHRRHVLHQPLVRHRADASQDRRADRLRRRRRQLLRQGGARPVRGRRSATANAWPKGNAACGKSRSVPGKYAFNTYAGNIVLVPTTNFVLHWVTGKSESHRYDESLRSIDLVTKDAYEPLLPLSVVVHIDYQRAPNVIQRFGDVKKLITQTLDPMLSAYFRDIAHKKTMLELLHERDVIQAEAREELRRRFHEFDIECVDVLIGKPDTAEAGGKIETLLEQLRQRQLSIEQLETYERQRDAVDKLKMLNEAQAQATMQTQLTNARVQVEIADSQAAAELARTRGVRPSRRSSWPRPTWPVRASSRNRRSSWRKPSWHVPARQAEQTVVAAEADSQREGAGRPRRIAARSCRWVWRRRRS